MGGVLPHLFLQVYGIAYPDSSLIQHLRAKASAAGQAHQHLLAGQLGEMAARMAEAQALEANAPDPKLAAD
jgi:hypothetical protein